MSIFSQEFENTKVKIKYFKPALHHGKVNKFANFFITDYTSKEGDENETFLVKSKDSISGYYFEQLNLFSKLIKPSDVLQKDDEEDTLSLFEIEFGRIKFGQTTFYQQEIKSPDGTVKGKKWLIAMNRTLPMTYSYFDQNGEKIVEKATMEEGITLKYPDQFYRKPLTYKRKEDLEKKYNEDKASIEAIAKNLCFRHNTRQLTGIIKEAFETRESKFVVKVASLKLKGKEKAKYTDAIELETRMIGALEKINENTKSGNNMNWHTPELYKEFQAIKDGYIKMLSDDIAAVESSGQGRFNNSVYVALSKNMLWCVFFTNNYKEAYERALKFERGDDAGVNATSIGSITSDFKISWLSLRWISQSYIQVYERNKERYNWN